MSERARGFWLSERPPTHWEAWYSTAPVAILDAACATFEQITRTPLAAVLAELRAARAGETREAALSRARRSCQRELMHRILRARRPLPEDRMRDRLVRWHLPGIPLRTARGVLRRLERLRALAPPRVGAAALSTAWNRWCTARRFGGIGPCVLHCSQCDGDEIEHYAICPVVRRFAGSFLRLHFPGSRGVALFTMAAPELDDDASLVRAGILVYAVWRCTEASRRGGPPQPPTFYQQALQQAAREAVRGHAGATRVLIGRGAPSYLSLG